jgi:hypothetical protein
MKKFYLILGLLALVCLSYSQDVLEFTLKKPLGNESSIYFHVKGLNNDEQADAIVQSLLDDSMISFARYFLSSQGKDRFHIQCSNDITAEYVRNILLTHNVDYDFSTVSINGTIENSAATNISDGDQLQRNDVNYPGFPKYNDTGNKQDDKKDYAKRKQQWVEANPLEYQEMLHELDENHIIEISKEDFNKLDEEKQIEVLNNTKKYIIK